MTTCAVRGVGNLRAVKRREGVGASRRFHRYCRLKRTTRLTTITYGKQEERKEKKKELVHGRKVVMLKELNHPNLPHST